MPDAPIVAMWCRLLACNARMPLSVAGVRLEVRTGFVILTT